MSGTHLDTESFHYFPDSEYFYYDGYADLNSALENHLIDAYLGDEPSLKSIHAQQPQIDYIKERLTNNKYSFAFRKDDPEEAALALGYSENQAFFRFILPQAALYFLPVYRGEAVSLLKSTSVVGYITVLDLTKMSDIIRARTYEAFFPLIATAVLYFLLSWIISLIIKAIIRHIDPKRSRKAKEVSA